MLPVLTQLLRLGDVSFYYQLLFVSNSNQIDDDGVASNDLCDDGATRVRLMEL